MFLVESNFLLLVSPLFSRKRFSFLLEHTLSILSFRPIRLNARKYSRRKKKRKTVVVLTVYAPHFVLDVFFGCRWSNLRCYRLKPCLRLS